MLQTCLPFLTVVAWMLEHLTPAPPHVATTCTFTFTHPAFPPTPTTTTTHPQEGFDHRGAWRTRQHAALLLGLINSFFQGGLLVHLEHALQDRDLSVPLHIEATQKLLASNTTALNQSFTPF
jgi:hypothetical protein